MKERPIIFSAPMVRAILDGHKTQTRRVVKFAITGPNDPRDTYDWHNSKGEWVAAHGGGYEFSKTNAAMLCPYGQPGDRLWVREAHCFLDVQKSARFPLVGGGRGPDVWNLCVEYSDGSENDTFSVEGKKPKQTRDRGESGWRPSIHMPRWASRITLEITDVRVERLQDISTADSLAEGVNVHADFLNKPRDSIYSPVQAFRDLWESINGPESWDANPFVWVIEFRMAVP